MSEFHIYSSIFIILYTSVYLAFYIKLRKFRKFFGPTSLILLVYVICGICSFIVYNDNELSNLYEGYGKLKLFPFVYLAFIVLIILRPTAKIEKTNDLSIQMPNSKIIVSFLLFYAICSLALLPNTISRIQDGLEILYYSSYGGQDLYTEGQLDVERNYFRYNGILTVFSIVQNSFNEIAIILMFYYMTFDKKKTWLIVLLSATFIADILKPIASGQRTGFVMSILSIILCYLIFKRYWNIKLQQKVSKIILVLLAIVSIPFISLTISRFSNNQGGITGSTISYVGQANLNFNLYCLDAGGTRHGDRVIRGFKSIIGMETTSSTRDTREKYSNMKIDDSVFYTYVGDFVLDFGPFLATVILLVYAFFIGFATRLKGCNIKFHQLLILYFTLSVSLKGSFYLFPYSYSGNQVIFAFFFMYLVFKFDSMNQASHISYLTIKK